MVFGKPHLIGDGSGSSPERDEPREFKILLRGDLTRKGRKLPVPRYGLPPLLIQIDFLKLGLVPPEEVLRVIHTDRVIGVLGIDEGDPAGTRELG
jgi:hypothetical protein